jgi:hypothetical protein
LLKPTGNEVEQPALRAGQPETGSRPAGRACRGTDPLGQLGYNQGDPAQARRDRQRAPRARGFRSQMRSLIDRFDLDQYMATLKDLHSYDH